MKQAALKWVLAASLFANLILLTAGLDKVLAALSAIPASIATFLTGIAGLMMVAWQTNRGLKNLIRAQAHRSKIERTARLHSDQISRDFDAAKRERERRDLAALLRAELSILSDNVCISINTEQSNIDTWKQFEISNPQEEIPLSKFSAPVFQSAIGNLGILGSATAEAVIRAYEILDANEKRALVHTYKTVVTARRSMWLVHKARAGYALDCLLSVEGGDPLPGPFHDSAHAQELRNSN